ncbi:extracellular solute-binding protein [Paenibacillus doosanensis]|uniref:ABC transporter substrate-binding protein n=1 Tax=Paenibacillus doosanensis TaxID=1229154 RepID=UPI00217FEA53|nr:extracellular solute-binding protein [Paenibacillus doosanensis]MCS7464703.1 extracellular solute-binding protein [Paenibacillus doosanensis]
MYKKVFAAAAVLTALWMLAACSGEEKAAENPGEAAAKTGEKPVTVKIYQWVAVSDDQWQQLFVEPVRKKYPYITLEQVVRGKGSNPDELVASGGFPDIFTIANDVRAYTSLGLTQDMSQLMKQENVDVSRFDPALVERSKVDGQIVAFPFYSSPTALYYNKDIFDKFAVPYPQDGMYWEDVINLAKQVTKMDAGFQYKGLHPQSIFAMKGGLPIDLLDAKTDEPTINNDQWKQLLTLYTNLVTIPGNEPKGGAFADVVNAFVKDKNTAMVISNIMPSLQEASKNGLNWDMAQLPSYKGYDGLKGLGDTMYMGINKVSKHQEDAMKVLSVLASEEVQTAMAKKYGYYPVLASQAVKDAFGAEMDFLQGKNVQAIYKGRIAPYVPGSMYSGNADVRKIFNGKVADAVAGKKDVNTALREADEEIAKLMPQIKQK